MAHDSRDTEHRDHSGRHRERSGSPEARHNGRSRHSSPSREHSGRRDRSRDRSRSRSSSRGRHSHHHRDRERQRSRSHSRSHSTERRRSSSRPHDGGSHRHGGSHSRRNSEERSSAGRSHHHRDADDGGARQGDRSVTPRHSGGGGSVPGSVPGSGANTPREDGTGGKSATERLAGRQREREGSSSHKSQARNTDAEETAQRLASAPIPRKRKAAAAGEAPAAAAAAAADDGESRDVSPKQQHQQGEAAAAAAAEQEEEEGFRELVRYLADKGIAAGAARGWKVRVSHRAGGNLAYQYVDPQGAFYETRGEVRRALQALAASREEDSDSAAGGGAATVLTRRQCFERAREALERETAAPDAAAASPEPLQELGLGEWVDAEAADSLSRPLLRSDTYVLSLGRIDSRAAFYDSTHIWPPGYCCLKVAVNCLDHTSGRPATLRCSILDGGAAPLFRIEVEGAGARNADGTRGTAVIDTRSEHEAWKGAMRALGISSSVPRHERTGAVLGGASFFAPAVQHLIEGLEGSLDCSGYRFQEQRDDALHDPIGRRSREHQTLLALRDKAIASWRKNLSAEGKAALKSSIRRRKEEEEEEEEEQNADGSGGEPRESAPPSPSAMDIDSSGGGSGGRKKRRREIKDDDEEEEDADADHAPASAEASPAKDEGDDESPSKKQEESSAAESPEAPAKARKGKEPRGKAARTQSAQSAASSPAGSGAEDNGGGRLPRRARVLQEKKEEEQKKAAQAKKEADAAKKEAKEKKKQAGPATDAEKKARLAQKAKERRALKKAEAAVLGGVAGAAGGGGGGGGAAAGGKRKQQQNPADQLKVTTHKNVDATVAARRREARDAVLARFDKEQHGLLNSRADDGVEDSALAGAAEPPPEPKAPAADRDLAIPGVSLEPLVQLWDFARAFSKPLGLTTAPSVEELRSAVLAIAPAADSLGGRHVAKGTASAKPSGEDAEAESADADAQEVARRKDAEALLERLCMGLVHMMVPSLHDHLGKPCDEKDVQGASRMQQAFAVNQLTWPELARQCVVLRLARDHLDMTLMQTIDWLRGGARRDSQTHRRDGQLDRNTLALLRRRMERHWSGENDTDVAVEAEEENVTPPRGSAKAVKNARDSPVPAAPKAAAAAAAPRKPKSEPTEASTAAGAAAANGSSAAAAATAGSAADADGAKAASAAGGAGGEGVKKEEDAAAAATAAGEAETGEEGAKKEEEGSGDEMEQDEEDEQEEEDPEAVAQALRRRLHALIADAESRDAALRRCAAVVLALLRHPFAGYFVTPVPAADLPDYRQVVARPVSLESLLEGLENGRYKRDSRGPAAAFVPEVRLMWENCWAYNSEATDACYAAMRLSSVAERLFREWLWRPNPPSLAVAEADAEPCAGCGKALELAEEEERPATAAAPKRSQAFEDAVECGGCDGLFHARCCRPPNNTTSGRFRPEWFCHHCIDPAAAAAAVPPALRAPLGGYGCAGRAAVAAAAAAAAGENGFTAGGENGSAAAGENGSTAAALAAFEPPLFCTAPGALLAGVAAGEDGDLGISGMTRWGPFPGLPPFADWSLSRLIREAVRGDGQARLLHDAARILSRREGGYLPSPQAWSPGERLVVLAALSALALSTPRMLQHLQEAEQRRENLRKKALSVSNSGFAGMLRSVGGEEAVARWRAALAEAGADAGDEEGAWAEEEEDDDVGRVPGQCSKCKESTVDQPDAVLLCDGCGAEWHLRCAKLKAVPKDDWFCPGCTRRAQKKEKDAAAGGAATAGSGKTAPALPKMEFEEEGRGMQERRAREHILKEEIVEYIMAKLRPPPKPAAAGGPSPAKKRKGAKGEDGGADASAAGDAAAPAAGGAEEDQWQQKKRPKKRCGVCEGCTAPDCNKCRFCKDMRKNGGPNTLRQPCIMRRCHEMAGDEVVVTAVDWEAELAGRGRGICEYCGLPELSLCSTLVKGMTKEETTKYIEEKTDAQPAEGGKVPPLVLPRFQPAGNAAAKRKAGPVVHELCAQAMLKARAERSQLHSLRQLRERAVEEAEKLSGFRTAPLGQDRHGRLYFLFHGDPGRVYVCKPTGVQEESSDLASSSSGAGAGVSVTNLEPAAALDLPPTPLSGSEWRVYEDPEDHRRLLAWLDPRGRREKALHATLTKELGRTPSAAAAPAEQQPAAAGAKDADAATGLDPTGNNGAVAERRKSLSRNKDDGPKAAGASSKGAGGKGKGKAASSAGSDAEEEEEDDDGGRGGGDSDRDSAKDEEDEEGDGAAAAAPAAVGPLAVKSAGRPLPLDETKLVGEPVLRLVASKGRVPPDETTVQMDDGFALDDFGDEPITFEKKQWYAVALVDSGTGKLLRVPERVPVRFTYDVYFEHRIVASEYLDEPYKPAEPLYFFASLRFLKVGGFTIKFALETVEGEAGKSTAAAADAAGDYAAAAAAAAEGPLTDEQMTRLLMTVKPLTHAVRATAQYARTGAAAAVHKLRAAAKLQKREPKAAAQQQLDVPFGQDEVATLKSAICAVMRALPEGSLKDDAAAAAAANSSAASASENGEPTLRERLLTWVEEARDATQLMEALLLFETAVDIRFVKPWYVPLTKRLQEPAHLLRLATPAAVALRLFQLDAALAYDKEPLAPVAAKVPRKKVMGLDGDDAVAAAEALEAERAARAAARAALPPGKTGRAARASARAGEKEALEKPRRGGRRTRSGRVAAETASRRMRGDDDDDEASWQDEDSEAGGAGNVDDWLVDTDEEEEKGAGRRRSARSKSRTRRGGSARGSEAGDGDDAETEGGEEPKTGWKCPQCTFLNVVEDIKCDMCGVRRPANFTVTTEEALAKPSRSRSRSRGGAARKDGGGSSRGGGRGGRRGKRQRDDEDDEDDEVVDDEEEDEEEEEEDFDEDDDEEAEFDSRRNTRRGRGMERQERPSLRERRSRVSYEERGSSDENGDGNGGRSKRGRADARRQEEEDEEGEEEAEHTSAAVEPLTPGVAEQRRRIAAVLAEVEKQRYAKPFVTAVKTQLSPGEYRRYKEKIARDGGGKPMYLGLISKRLAAGAFDAEPTLASVDVETIKKNCYAWNDHDSEISTAARKLLRTWTRLFSQWVESEGEAAASTDAGAELRDDRCLTCLKPVEVDGGGGGGAGEGGAAVCSRCAGPFHRTEGCGGAAEADAEEGRWRCPLCSAKRTSGGGNE